MKYVGYFLLLLLLIYFSIVKPYLLLKGVHVETKGLYWDIKKKSLVIDRFLIYIPKLHNSSLFVYVGSLSLNPEEIHAGEVSVIEVSKEISKEPFDYDFTNLVKLAERVNLSVGKVYVSINSLPARDSITVFVDGAELKNSTLISQGWSRALYMKERHTHELYVFLKRAHVKDGVFYVDEAQVVGPYYLFSLSGRWKGKSGDFHIAGFIKGYESQMLTLPKIGISASGNIDYTSISMDYIAKADYLMIQGKNLGPVSGRGTFKNKRLTGEFIAGKTHASLDYRWHPEEILHVSFTDLPVDNYMLKTQTPISLDLSGSLVVYLKQKLLSLKGFSDNLFLIDRNFKGFSIDISLDYSKRAGKVDLSVNYPSSISVSGSFVGKDFDGNVQAYMFPYSYDKFSTYLNYVGKLRYANGEIYTSGTGKLLNPIYSGMSLGDILFDLNLANDKYRVEFLGKGVRGEGEGSIKDKSFTGVLVFSGYSLDAMGKNITGRLKVKVLSSEFAVDGSLEGIARRGDISARIKAELDLFKKDKWNGSFSVSLEDIKKGKFHVPHVDVKGKVQGDTLQAEYSFKYAKGSLRYYLEGGSYSSLGSIVFQHGEASLKGDYHLDGKGKDLTLDLAGYGIYRNYSFPIRLSLKRVQGELKGVLKGFSSKLGLFHVELADSLLEGSEDKGILKLGSLTVSVNSEKLIEIPRSEGYIDIKNSSFSLPNINITGLIKGVASLSYQKGELSVSSYGTLDLDGISGLVKSRLLAYAKGQLDYAFEKNTNNLKLEVFSKKDIEVRSRFIAVPMRGKVYVIYNNSIWKGFAHLSGDGTHARLTLSGDDKLLSLSFTTEHLPALFRSESVRFNGFAKTEGSIITNYKNINIKANVELSGNLSVKKLNAKSQEKPQAYKLITLNIKLSTPEPIRVSLPEGYVYTYADGDIGGSLYEPNYRIKLNLMGGSLTYFNKEFDIREGTLLLSPKEKNLNITMVSPTPDYNIIIDIKGNIDNPKALVRSEPPRDTREVLTSLILGGGTGEGLLSLYSALIAEFPEFNRLVEGVKNALGTDVKINITPTTSSTGEAAVNTKVSKDITNRLNVEYQQSTAKDPKETYGGANLRITPNTSVGVRIYSNNAQEYKIRIRKKFDF